MCKCLGKRTFLAIDDEKSIDKSQRKRKYSSCEEKWRDIIDMSEVEVGIS